MPLFPELAARGPGVGALLAWTIDSPWQRRRSPPRSAVRRTAAAAGRAGDPHLIPAESFPLAFDSGLW